MHPFGRVPVVFFLAASYSWPATVCEVLDHRLALNGKEIEVEGYVFGGQYIGSFVYEKDSGAPCANRWIFSWPSALGLAFHGLEGERFEALANSGKAINAVVKGRLTTRSDAYIIRLPWRRQLPIGRFFFGGVAGFIAVSDIKFKGTSADSRPFFAPL